MTRLFSGEVVPKCAPRIEALGTLDELVSVIGIARAMASPAVSRELRNIQRALFVLGSEIATTGAEGRLRQRIDAKAVAAMDRRERRLERTVAWPSGFVVPGASLAAAHIDLARAIARRLERRLAQLWHEGEVSNPHVRAWVNRLSDCLWLLARKEEPRPDLLAAARRARRP